MTEYFIDYCKEVLSGVTDCICTFHGKQISQKESMDLFCDIVRNTKDKDGKLFFCGNGASCTISEHFSHDWFQNGKLNTYTCSETSHITAISNDLSYEDVFSYRIKRVMGPNDILITVSSSGNSPNIISAIKAAKNNGSFVVSLSGKSSDNLSIKNADLSIWVPLDTYGLVETAHALILHELLDEYLNRFEGGRH